MKKNPIPADQASWSVYGKLQEENRELLCEILEEAAKPSPSRTPSEQKIGDYYSACTDEAAINAAGRGEWDITASTVDAYYNPQMNDINFPAGVLQPPLYDPKMDDAVNYGATGSTVGHELAHGFDDEGRQFDGQGICETGGRRAMPASLKSAPPVSSISTRNIPSSTTSRSTVN